MGFPCSGTFALLYILNSPRSPQNRYHPPPQWREAGRSWLSSNGNRPKATLVLEETCCKLTMLQGTILYDEHLFQRKCWWDGIDVELPDTNDQPSKTIKLWARRVWTLELSLVRQSAYNFLWMQCQPFTSRFDVSASTRCIFITAPSSGSLIVHTFSWIPILRNTHTIFCDVIWGCSLRFCWRALCPAYSRGQGFCLSITVDIQIIPTTWLAVKTLRLSRVVRYINVCCVQDFIVLK